MILPSNERPRKTHRKFSAVFKQQIAEIVFSSPEKTYATIAKEYGLTCHLVARWAKESLNPETHWVKKLDFLAKNENIETEISVTQTPEPTIPLASEETFAIDVLLPTGTRISISNLNTDQLQAVLRICR